MTPEQVIEKEAEYLYNFAYKSGRIKPAYAWPPPTVEEHKYWRNEALSHFAALNSWGGCMKAEDQSVPWCDNDLPSALRAKEGYKKAGFLKTVPLPEKLPQETKELEGDPWRENLRKKLP